MVGITVELTLVKRIADAQPGTPEHDLAERELGAYVFNQRIGQLGQYRVKYAYGDDPIEWAYVDTDGMGSEAVDISTLEAAYRMIAKSERITSRDYYQIVQVGLLSEREVAIDWDAVWEIQGTLVDDPE